MLRKVSYAGAKSPSFVGATEDLIELAERTVSRERVQRWTKRVGQECVEEAEALADEYQVLPLPQQQKSPTDQVPQVACVMMDGGRIQVRDRHQAEGDAKGYWKESLVGCCLSMVSQEWAQDPCPAIPQTFVDRERMDELCREIKGFSASEEDDDDPCEEPLDGREGRPETLVKSIVATPHGKGCFGPTTGRRSAQPWLPGGTPQSVCGGRFGDELGRPQEALLALHTDSRFHARGLLRVRCSDGWARRPIGMG